MKLAADLVGQGANALGTAAEVCRFSPAALVSPWLQACGSLFADDRDPYSLCDRQWHSGARLGSPVKKPQS
jgi:hypothetical protein